MVYADIYLVVGRGYMDIFRGPLKPSGFHLLPKVPYRDRHKILQGPRTSSRGHPPKCILILGDWGGLVEICGSPIQISVKFLTLGGFNM